MILRIAGFSGSYLKGNLLNGGVILKSGLTAKDQGQLIYNIKDFDVEVFCGEFKDVNKDPRYFLFNKTIFVKRKLYKYLKNK